MWGNNGHKQFYFKIIVEISIMRSLSLSKKSIILKIDCMCVCVCVCVYVCVIVMHLKTIRPILILLFAKCSLRVAGGRRTIPVSKFLSVSIWRTKCYSPHKIAC